MVDRLVWYNIPVQPLLVMCCFHCCYCGNHLSETKQLSHILYRESEEQKEICSLLYLKAVNLAFKSQHCLVCVLFYYRCHWKRDWTKLFNISTRNWNIKPIINIFPNPRLPGWRKADQDTTREVAFSQGCWDRAHVASSSHFTLRDFFPP